MVFGCFLGASVIQEKIAFFLNEPPRRNSPKRKKNKISPIFLSQTLFFIKEKWYWSSIQDTVWNCVSEKDWRIKRIKKRQNLFSIPFSLTNLSLPHKLFPVFMILFFPWIDADALVTQFTSKFFFFYLFFSPQKRKKKEKKGECNVYCKTNDNPNSYLCYWDNKGVMFFRQGVSSLGFASPSTTSSSHWTLFSKFFATFPRGTCMLSIFRRNI